MLPLNLFHNLAIRECSATILFCEICKLQERTYTSSRNFDVMSALFFYENQFISRPLAEFRVNAGPPFL